MHQKDFEFLAQHHLCLRTNVSLTCIGSNGVQNMLQLAQVICTPSTEEVADILRKEIG